MSSVLADHCQSVKGDFYVGLGCCAARGHVRKLRNDPAGFYFMVLGEFSRLTVRVGVG